MSPWVMIVSTSVGSRPWPRSKVSTLSISSPENAFGRRSARQPIIRWRSTWPVTSSRRTVFGISFLALLTRPSAGAPSTPAAIGESEKGYSGKVEMTRRAVAPAMRAST